MAEAGAGLDIRRLLLVGGVIVVILFAMLFFLFRSCVPAVRGPGGFTVVYSNLDLRDAANVIARLKELNIKYEIRENGRALAVPKDKADEARLGLAEKNLPAGGVVGWEIFDESKLGATDFDRRIQLIRAISGELSRTIRRIEGVEDVRVQIVIPETRLFAASVVPVTASVMLKLQPGVELSVEKINGVVHLVASSVENLQPENVTVIDDTGKILTARLVSQEALAIISPAAELQLTTSTTLLAPKIIFASSEAVTTAEATTTVATLPVQAITTLEAAVTSAKPLLTAEEKIMLRVQAKKELERDLAGKAQEILNRFYPPNSSIVKINIDFKMAAKGVIVKTKEINDELKIAQVTTIILVDNRLEIKPKLKEATYKAVAAAIGYNKKRGDRIVLQKVPFHLATTLPETTPGLSPPSTTQPKMVHWLGTMTISGFVIFALIIGFWLFRNLRFSHRQIKPELRQAEPVRPTEAPQLEGLRAFAENNPEKIAELLRNWLTE